MPPRTDRLPVSSAKATPSPLEIKGSMFTLSVLCLKSADLDAVERALIDHIAQAPRFFQDAPVVIDVQAVRDAQPMLDFTALVALLRQQHLVPVAVRHATTTQQAQAVTAGLAVMAGTTPLESRPRQVAAEITTPPADTALEPRIEISPAAATEIAPVPTTPRESLAEAPGDKLPNGTRVITQPVRSGQQIYARGGDLILLAPVSCGAEVLADGHIHAYAPLRGRALAGVNGDTTARIFCQALDAELVSVAGHYRVFEPQPPEETRGKPVHIYLEGERLMIVPLM